MLKETCVVIRIEMGFELTKRIQRNTDHDQDRGATNIERHIQSVFQMERTNANYSQENGSRERNAGQNVVNILSGLLSRTDARNKTTRLL